MECREGCAQIVKLSKPAMMSAFLCPGLGQWAAGYRLLGAALVGGTVFLVLEPFARYFWDVLNAPPCDPFARGILGCSAFAMKNAWLLTWQNLALNVVLVAVVYVSSVWHANGLTLPDAS